jgi:hypothetical protein
MRAACLFDRREDRNTGSDHAEVQADPAISGCCFPRIRVLHNMRFLLKHLRYHAQRTPFRQGLAVDWTGLYRSFHKFVQFGRNTPRDSPTHFKMRKLHSIALSRPRKLFFLVNVCSLHLQSCCLFGNAPKIEK